MGTARTRELPTFIYMLKPRRASLIDEANQEEEARLEEHFVYLQQALEEGSLVLAGPCLDGELGVVLFRAPTEEAALEFMEGDPAVKHLLTTGELPSFRFSLVGTARANQVARMEQVKTLRWMKPDGAMLRPEHGGEGR
jgi:uncharacterized protein YciI